MSEQTAPIPKNGPADLIPQLLKIAKDLEYRARLVRVVSVSNAFVDEANAVRDAMGTIAWAHGEILSLRKERDEMKKEVKLLTDANDALTMLTR
jgi:hypothetical protein